MGVRTSKPVVAIVPARGGSKGLLRKNLRLVAGQPLVAHSLLAGLGASSVSATYLSTDDDEIAALGDACGATVIRRPPELASDTVQNDAVMRHALEVIRHSGADPDIAVLLQPTSPLRRAIDIDKCVALFRHGAPRSVVSICPVDHHPGKAVTIRDGLLEPFTNDHDMEARRQELPEVFRQNGAIYVVGVEDFLANGRFYARPCLGYVMDRRDSIDIDDEVDLNLTEALFAARSKGEQ